MEIGLLETVRPRWPGRRFKMRKRKISRKRQQQVRSRTAAFMQKHGMRWVRWARYGC